MTKERQVLQDKADAMYKKTYYLPNENHNDWLNRVSKAYQNDEAHGARIKSYIAKKWFHPSTPISSNAGTARGLPISCFTSTLEDNKSSIFNSWANSSFIGADGGGEGKCYSKVAEANCKINNGTTAGIIPFMRVENGLVEAVSQGGNRRFSEVVWLDISHPDILDFLDVRKATGDITRRTPLLSIGVVIPNTFMFAVITGADWDLISPRHGNVVSSVPARELWIKILTMRSQTGFPHIAFKDNIEKAFPHEYKDESVEFMTSNLCSEILLRTDDKHSGVCCLASINLAHYDEFKHDFKQLVKDCADYLDNVLQSYIDLSEHKQGHEKFRNGAIDERSLGLGVMGFGTYLQKRNIPWESPMATGINNDIFSKLSQYCYDASIADSKDKICPMAKRTGSNRRNIHVSAIAPTQSISNLVGTVSPSIEPVYSNAYVDKVKQGVFIYRNPELADVLATKGLSDERLAEIWKQITIEDGSCQNIDELSAWEKDVFKTAHEINPMTVLNLQLARTPYIDQAISFNIFINANPSLQDLSDLHIHAWAKGLKTFYYQRGKSANKANTRAKDRIIIAECTSCQ